MTRLNRRQPPNLKVGLAIREAAERAEHRVAAPSPKESDIQRQIKEYLQWHGWFVFKNHQSLGSYPGVADLYALRAGRSVWIEVKTPAGSQSADQVRFQADIGAHGGEYIVARGVEDVEHLGRCKA